MPTGRTHDRITLWTLPWIVGLTLLFTRNTKLSLIIAGGFLFSGLMFGPDLDIYSIQFKRWGKLSFIWLPYQKMLRHRSLFSHGPIIGTTLRVIYFLSLLTFLGILILGVSQLVWGFDWNWQEFTLKLIKGYGGEAIALFLGLELGALSHSLSDWIVSASKRYQKTSPKPKRPTKRKTPQRRK
ncbi:MAG: metal-binding protein [Gomphosphaeria aponina SAG 52.96 = DSM 107014]|uniref:Metal-binding protein n=1 Tax=Gomphosphaeria aponina SAG 52.96 = DSM 107014 TaxID=1521640 RepID=A0A941JLH0_9CHRO|nr:metal-binding protein [Gomphosphaeria aponina SAG 52.96 = DSM 107014]